MVVSHHAGWRAASAIRARTDQEVSVRKSDHRFPLAIMALLALVSLASPAGAQAAARKRTAHSLGSTDFLSSHFDAQSRWYTGPAVLAAWFAWKGKVGRATVAGTISTARRASF